MITVGVPGSGKSHWARAFAAANGYEVVETDAIRKEVTGSFGDQSENTRVFDIFYDTVGETLARGANVVADSTGIHGGIRSRLCEAAEVAGSANAGVHVVCFDNQHQSGWRNLKRIGRKHVPRRAQRKFRLSLARSKAALVADEAAGYASVFFVQDYSGSSTRGKFIVSDKV